MVRNPSRHAGKSGRERRAGLRESVGSRVSINLSMQREKDVIAALIGGGWKAGDSRR